MLSRLFTSVILLLGTQSVAFVDYIISEIEKFVGGGFFVGLKYPHPVLNLNEIISSNWMICKTLAARIFYPGNGFLADTAKGLPHLGAEAV